MHARSSIATYAMQVLDGETVKLAAAEFGVEVLDAVEGAVDQMAKKTTDYIEEDDLDFLVTRPPVVTVMGHVDHGKVASDRLSELLLGSGVTLVQWSRQMCTT